MKFKPQKCKKTGKIFCLVRLDPGETKEDIKKRDSKIREECLNLCQSEDEAIGVANSPIEVIGEACGFYIAIFLEL